MSDPGQDFAIAIRDVHKSFGSTKALDGVTFEVRRGQSHALLGRNGAGKSTLISILSGLTEPDRGTADIRGAGASGPAGSHAPEVACVYQHSTLVGELTAAENISLGDYPTGKYGQVDWAAVSERAKGLLEEWGFAHIADRLVSSLEPLERKVVEVCRALSLGPRILLLDEPTAGLDEDGCQRLFAQLDRARQRGVTIVYVSHHLDEIFHVCDAVTILRDGRDVRSALIGDVDMAGIVASMSGVETAVHEPAAAARGRDADAPVVLDVQSLSVGALRDIDLVVRRGEAVGLAGLDGAGHVQLAQAVAGHVRSTFGVVEVNGKRLRPGDLRDAIGHGVGFVPEDRLASGFSPWMSVEENATMTIWDRLRNWAGFLGARERRQRFDDLSARWDLKASSPHQPVGELSGGNQQKAVLVRALAGEPSVLVLINPTAGVDVTAKASIYRSVRALQDAGCAILLASTDDDDLRICDRVAVMFRQELVSELGHGWSERDLVAAIQGAGHAA